MELTRQVGFVAVSQNNQQSIALLKQKQLLEMENLKKQIEHLAGLPLENKKTRQLSIIAIVIAGIAIVVEIIKSLFAASALTKF